MAEDLITSLYPPPPPYYKYFTPENLAQYKEWTNSSPDTPLPGELRLQVPPEVPSADQYRGYGSVWSLENKLPSLKDLGWRQLYRDEDETITSKAKIEELHKLLDSLLLNFLELVASVSVEPGKFYVKIEHLKLILINMNHLLNTYRPHQTRESLIMLLQSQIDSKKAEIAEMDLVTRAVKQAIADLVLSEPAGAGGDAPETEPPQETDSVRDSERSRKLEVLQKLMAESPTA
ncbi:MED7-domain-containing protein [Metschnikowia bicuspidata var. bicuspidata NRRL YB-4993]|uniref:Mediator of RNA polymerase II transcription subunit 7 n=1 Tax=Metschnikowia bicuspidata var. bicuspidata NRRL YB-4993 TaxID=869754 RepID=A0A1A0HHN3_9ASCO|nr:MED7-domain-containing protein [Metschnikowia bicuspidata var. bicuspidata NRRL YB-4993]OBA23515.1 MED7-domain-containing protein [Metschnikowia bicuspidata var. bicuspidata NRRL YB-4993]